MAERASNNSMKIVVYLVVIAIVGAVAWFVARPWIIKPPPITGPSVAEYVDSLATAFPLQNGTFEYPQVADLARAGRDLLGKEAVAEWLQPILEAGWVFKGCNDPLLPGAGKSAVFVFEKEGKRVLLFGQSYHGLPDLKAHQGQVLTMACKAPIAECRMHWNGGGVFYFATSQKAGEAGELAKAFGWPEASGEWR